MVQAILVSFAGYFFYLIRRSTGTLIVGALVHGLFDFSIVTGQLTGDFYTGTLAALLLYPVVGAVVFIRRRRIEPA